MRDRQLVTDLVKSQTLPKMFRVRQKFSRPQIDPLQIPEIIGGYLSKEPPI